MNATELNVILTIIATFAVFAIICITLVFHIIKELRRVYEIGFHLKEIIKETEHQIHNLKQDILEEVERRVQDQDFLANPSARSYGKVLNIGNDKPSFKRSGHKEQIIGRE